MTLISPSDRFAIFGANGMAGSAIPLWSVLATFNS